MSNPSVSVVITSRNEQRDLDVTVALAAGGSIEPLEVIVVDDASDYAPVGKRLFHIPRTHVIRNHEQVGCAASRNIGAAAADGDLIIFMDSHMRFPWWWLEPIIEAHAQYPDAIFCASTRGFDVGWRGPTSGMNCSGARFATDEVEIQVRWLDKTSGTPIVPVILGACYIIPHGIWDTLGGFNPNFYGWGQDEQDISIRAWQMGFECRCIADLQIAHKWNRTLKGDFMQGWHAGYNAAVNAATLFEDGVFEMNYRPFLEKRFPDSPVWRRFETQIDRIMAFRNTVQARRILTDAQVEEKAGRIIPTVDEQRTSLRHRLWSIPHPQRSELLAKENAHVVG